MTAGLPVYAYEEFDGSPWIAGAFYAALGAGALVGSLVAIVVVRRVAPLRLAGVAILAFLVPMWVLPFLPPWPVVLGALFVASFFAPLINGPVFGVLTARTPEALRAKVMTAVVAVNTLAAPLGFLAAGQILEHWGVAPLFAVVTVGMTVTGLAFAAIARRHTDDEQVAPVAVT